MSFLYPASLAFLATLPVITALYFLKLRRTRRLVPATLLWEQAIREMRANTPFQRLRGNLLLFLQLLLAALLALSLARPYLRGVGAAAGKRVIVLDASASMKASAGSRSRFDAARAEALRSLSGTSGAETMVLWAGPRARVAQPFTSDVRALQDSLATLRASEAPGDLGRALSLALAITSKDKMRDIVIMTDRAAPPLPALQASAPGVRLYEIGEAQGNVAITSFDAVRSPVSARDWDVFVGVTNQSDAEVEKRVVLRLGERVLDARSVRIPARASRGVVMPCSSDGGQPLMAEIEGEDALAADNKAYGVLPVQADRHVAIVSPSGKVDAWLERALRPEPGVVLHPLASGESIDADAYDLVVFDGVTPDTVVPGAYLFLDPRHEVLASQAAGGGKLFTVGEGIPYPAILDWDRKSDLLRYVTFADVHLREGRPIAPGEGTRSLADLEAGPVLVSSTTGPIRFAAMGFDFRGSDLPYRAAFPILLGNAVATLPFGSERARPLCHLAGERVTLDLPPSISSFPVTVQDPSGEKHPATLLAGRYVLEDTMRVGMYRVEVGDKEAGTFAVSLLSREESDLTPRLSLTGPAGGSGEGEVRAIRREIAPWLLALGLAALLFEWLVYHRRSYA